MSKARGFLSTPPHVKTKAGPYLAFPVKKIMERRDGSLKKNWMNQEDAFPRNSELRDLLCEKEILLEGTAKKFDCPIVGVFSIGSSSLTRCDADLRRTQLSSSVRSSDSRSFPSYHRKQPSTPSSGPRASLVALLVVLALVRAVSSAPRSDAAASGDPNSPFVRSPPSSRRRPDGADQGFVFTQPSYNTTIKENSDGRVYVASTVKMGIFLADESVEVNYRIVAGDQFRFFKTESKRVGDFVFLRVRTRTGNNEVLNRERQSQYRLTVKAVGKSNVSESVDTTNGYRYDDGMTAPTERFQTFASVVVNVLDTNDLMPLFYLPSYTVSVPEDKPLHTAIIKVSASDADVGVNGEIYYSFLDDTDVFSIHPTTGVVTLTRHLDYARERQYRLRILARDRGAKFRAEDGSKQSTAKLDVSVVQVNFHAPDIQLKHLPALAEHGPSPDVTYAILYISDPDSGRNGEVDDVAIVDGDPNRHFVVSEGLLPKEFNIKTTRTIDREANPYGYNLTIRATDKGRPQKVSTKVIRVKIMDKNDHPPSFGKRVYDLEVDEIAPRNTPLIILNATDTDTGKNAEIMYYIRSGNSRGHFAIHSSTGLLYVAKQLDAETLDEYQLVVEARDQGNRGDRKIGKTTVNIKVRDSNDNSPVFRNPPQDRATPDNPKIIEIEEATPADTEVFKVSATDADDGENGYISYSIANLHATPFVIDHFSGAIRTKQIIDYESMRRSYKLSVRASDWGQPYRREAEITLQIDVRGSNDNRPVFEKHQCAGHVSRRASIGTQLVVVSAIDFDTSDIISYQIVAGNRDKCFSLDSLSGRLTLSCDLSRHPEDLRSLTVIATDGDFNSDPIHINITILNVETVDVSCKSTGVTARLSQLLQEAERNNKPLIYDDLQEMPDRFLYNRHEPAFADDLPSEIVVSENVRVGAAILEMRATDLDQAFNGKIVYVVERGNDHSCFKIDMNYGILSIQRPVDRELRDKYYLEISACDLGSPQKCARHELNVVVKDVNDNPPVFQQSSYVVTNISEATKVGATILQVSATDADQGLNARVSYSILTDTRDFTIDSKTGVIAVANRLDRETIKEYTLVIEASDSSIDSPPLTAVAVVKIDVTDVNDFSPLFHPPSYSVRVLEDTPVGAVVMIVSAFDPDAGPGGVIKYSIKDGDEGKFAIDKQTGTIRLAERLDFETKQMYNLTIQARDKGDPPLMSMAQLIVEVVDVNENNFAPEFDSFVTQGRVEENLPIGTKVMQVKATDADGPGGDSKITYSIRDGNGLGRFTIDADDGVIRTNEILDRETQRLYWLTVYAQDRGAVPLFSTIEVCVEVVDVNDNVPQTSEVVYYPHVLENSPPDTPVVRITATDRDDIAGGGSRNLRFQILKGNPQGFFSLDERTGFITTTDRKLDREAQPEHILEVAVIDQGSIGEPALSSTARVVVAVDDVNDHPPKFTERLYRVRIPERRHLGFGSGGKSGREIDLYRVFAFDKDVGPNADIDYSIKSGRGHGRFKIHPKTGMISSDRDFSEGEEYDLSIRAVDNGRPQNKATTRLRITVEATPKNGPGKMPPRFISTAHRYNVVESDAVGSMVAIVSADDDDNDKLWYSLGKNGNIGDKFAIGTENGNIMLAGQLDWEKRTYYNLTVNVTDGLNFASTHVYITVLDINEHRPRFSKKEYIVNISESIAPNSDIMTLSATDEDEDRRLLYTIHSAMNSASRKYFRIDSSSGTLFINAPLDREAIHQHVLTVMVKDQATPSKRNFARVLVNVQDHNDHKPVFLSDLFEGRVLETAAIETNVVQVVATDRDKGQNAVINYHIAAGNIGGAFHIDRSLGIISVAKMLDRKSVNRYNLVVTATDGGSPALASSVNVHIEVTVSNNAPPVFDYDEYTTEILENLLEGSFVVTVGAKSQSTVTYRILNGNIKNVFAINPNSGVISTKGNIDYEEQNFYNLTVEATNMVSTSSNTSVHIHITDVNDNAPKFVKRIYRGNVSEASSVGSVVLDNSHHPLVIEATDEDTDLNSLLLYEISDHFAQDYFSIDPSTGAIRTIRNMDHETISWFEFVVQVQDLGRPRLTAEAAARVIIYITDVNDSPPMFPTKNFNVTLLLPTYKDVLVVNLNASDEDSGSGSDLQYSIISGNDDGKFSLDEKLGEIRVIDPDPTTMGNYYKLRVRVSDAKFANFADVQIRVTESMNSGLKFSQQSYNADVFENSTEIETVAAVQVVGSALNEHLKFSILNPSVLFRIVPSSGVVQTTGIPLDREVKDSYTIVVEARDHRQPIPRIAHVLVNVRVKDVNDNAPVFLGLPYFAVVPIDARKGHLIKRIDAVDFDLDNNSKLRYRIVDGENGKFRIMHKTGDLLVKRPLRNPSDQNEVFNLVIEAEDNGNPTMATRVNVPIKVIHDSQPVFDQPFYSVVSIPENIQRYTPVMSIQAKPPQGYPRGFNYLNSGFFATTGSDISRRLIYSIVDGDASDDFTVDYNTGVISVINSLDFESIPAYQLTVRASDSLTGTSTEAMVNIELEDVNDNPPVFLKDVYTVSISEAVAIGTEVVKVKALDKDSKNSVNSMIQYSIVIMEDNVEKTSVRRDISQAIFVSKLDATFVNATDYFHVEPATGILRTKRMLNHEHAKIHRLIVMATDQGKPSLSSSALVNINVQDLNDHVPQFDKPSGYSCWVSDEAQRGHLVTMVTARDADDESAYFGSISGNEREGSLRYAIVAGNENQSFMVNATTGIITVTNLQDAVDPRWRYILNVSVSDGVFTNYVRLQVNIRSSNHHSPVFEKLVYDVNFKENQPTGSFVGRVKATDNDRGKYGMIVYSLKSAVVADLFDINTETGEITSLAVLDREKRSVYELPVAAIDGGGRAGFASVRIKIADDNDNKPQFKMKEYKAQINPDAPLDSHVVKVVAVDADGEAYNNINYSLYGKDRVSPFQMFRVDSSTGIVRVARDLRRYESEVFQFFIRASNIGKATNEGDVPVEVFVMSKHDSAPNFEKTPSPYFIPEDKPVGSIITTVVASSNETNLKYSIVPGENRQFNEPAKFSINQIGQISLIEPLDREEIEVYTLNIKAETQSTPPLVAYVEVIVQVMDVNDMRPIFEANPYVISLPENAKVGSQVIQVKATDRDTGSNAEISYAFSLNTQSSGDDNLPEKTSSAIGDSFGGETGGGSIFAIDSKTGWIRTLEVLDRENRSSFFLKVQASDKGSPERMTDTTMVQIRITDVNDSPPIFTKAVYKGQVSEAAKKNTVVVSLFATDADTGDNSEISYYITKGDIHSHFVIRRTGEIMVNKGLDREKISEYDLEISATDGAHVAIARVIISVLDENDNAPVCKSMRYSKTIPEDITLGRPVLQVEASDADYGLNSHLKYKLYGDGSEKFSLNPDNGFLTTIGKLDRESQDAYLLIAKVEDGGGHACQVDVIIKVTDINDNPPRFNQPQYTVTIPENAQVKTLLTRVSATDPDVGINRKVRYSFVHSAKKQFRIDDVSGLVSLAKPLDRERQQSFNLTVKAADLGTPMMSSTAHLIVLVLDVNDNPPIFERTQYSETVSELARVGTSVLRVLATSKDAGQNAEITYSLVAGNEHDKFRIDSKSGVISIVQPLDYEGAHDYFLKVQANDGGSPSLSSHVIVAINVTDENDNVPTFNQKEYAAVVRENAQLGEKVIQIVATDGDSPKYGTVSYELKALGSGGLRDRSMGIDTFKISKTDGTISLSASLDREKTSSYILEIHAKDNGQPPLSAKTIISIEVTDSNDNPPVFSSSNYTAVVQEDRPVGYSILEFEVSDVDSPPNGEPFNFAIISGDEENKFMINHKTGTLSTRASFNRKLKSNYTLRIRAFDNGTPPLFADTWVNVKVIEESKFPPAVTPLNVQIASFLDDFPGGNIGRVKATDRDLYDRLSYGLINQNHVDSLFNIRSMDGTVMAEPGLDVGRYTVNVSVSDGRFTSYAPVTVTVTLVTREMRDSAVVIQFQNVLPDEFVIFHYQNFLNALRTELEVQPQDVMILSIQPSYISRQKRSMSFNNTVYDMKNNFKTSSSTISHNQETKSFHSTFDEEVNENFEKENFSWKDPNKWPYQWNDGYVLDEEEKMNGIWDNEDDSDIKKRSMYTDSNDNLDVMVAVRKPTGGFMRAASLRRRLNHSVSTLESKLQVKIVKIFDENCFQHPGMCHEGMCRSRLIIDSSQVNTIATEQISYVTVRHKWSTVCDCKEGFGGPRCDKAINECSRSPCPVYKLCRSTLSGGYECVCPRGRAGPTCTEIVDDSSLAPIDPRPICPSGKFSPNCVRPVPQQRPISFKGSSYISYSLAESLERRMELSLRFKTLERTGNIMYQAGKDSTDFAVLEVKNGLVQYRFDCGSGEGLVRVEQIYVNDGTWHDVEVQRDGNSAKILLDGKFADADAAPGRTAQLNLGTDSTIYFGAEVPEIYPGTTDIRKGFKGCMDSIRLAGIRLPLEGSNVIVTGVQLYNVDFQCKDEFVPPGVCGGRPCLNGGTCIDAGDGRFSCRCHSRFRGDRCEIDTDPCASSPCLHDGVCHNVGGLGEYQCICRPPWHGQRCELGNCSPNPCRHGGTCQEGASRPICMCKGFEGDYCERDINECLQSPCQNGATCHNLQGSFRCNCSADTKGLLCQDIVFSSITSNKININLEEIVGILGVLASLILIVLLFVAYRRCRRRRRMHDSGHRGSQVAGVAISDGGLRGGANGLGDIFVSKEDFKRSSNAKLSSLDGSASLYNPAAPDPGSSPIRCGSGFLTNDGAKAAAFAENAVNEHINEQNDGREGVCSPAGIPPEMLTGSENDPSILLGAGFKSSRPRDPIPPPIPTRPASYTPSTHDSVNTLNNFDTVHNYGSAADDLENLHIYSPEFLKNLTKNGGLSTFPANNGSDTESMQKTSSWAEESSLTGDSSVIGVGGAAAFQRLYAGIQRLVTDGSVPAPPGAGGHPRALLVAASGLPADSSQTTTGESSVSGWTSNGGSLQTIEEADLMQEQTEPLINGQPDGLNMLTGSQQESLSQLGLVGTIGGLGGGPTTIGGALVPEDYHWDTSDWEPHPEMEPLHPHLQGPSLQLAAHLDDLKVSDTGSSIRSSDEVTTDAESTSNLTTIASSSIHPGLPVSPQPPFMLSNGTTLTSLPIQYTHNFPPGAYSAVQSSSIPSSASSVTGSQGPILIGTGGLQPAFPPGSAAAAVAAAAAQLDSVSEVTCLGENEGESDYLGDESDFLDYGDTDTNDTGLSSDGVRARIRPPHIPPSSGFDGYNSTAYSMSMAQQGPDYIPHASPGHFSLLATSESENNWPDMTPTYGEPYVPVSSAATLMPPQMPPNSFTAPIDPSIYRLYAQPQPQDSSRPLDPVPDYPDVSAEGLFASGAVNSGVGHPALGLDAMSVSGIGGYTSTNASCSDISGLCEIEDSEVNLSDYDSDQNGGLHGSTLGLSSQV